MQYEDGELLMMEDVRGQLRELVMLVIERGDSLGEEDLGESRGGQ